jgi:hypothetical protein
MDQPFFEASLVFFTPEPGALVSMQNEQPWIWAALP